MEWEIRKYKCGEVPHWKNLKKNTIYYYESKGEHRDGFLKFICPVCNKQEHNLLLEFEYDKPKSEWWHPRNTWSFKPNETPFKLDPSVQTAGGCKGHFWFKQGKPRIY